MLYTILISGDYIKTVYSPIEQKGKITESTSDNSEKWFDFIFTMVAPEEVEENEKEEREKEKRARPPVGKLTKRKKQKRTTSSQNCFFIYVQKYLKYIRMFVVFSNAWFVCLLATERFSSSCIFIFSWFPFLLLKASVSYFA